jgi:hypothetical protein
MHHELLNDPVDWRRQNLRLGLAFGLDHVLGEARRLFFYFGQFVELSNPDSWQRIHTLAFASFLCCRGGGNLHSIPICGGTRPTTSSNTVARMIRKSFSTLISRL